MRLAESASAIQIAAINQTFCVINSSLCLSALAGVISYAVFLFRKANSIALARLYRHLISDQSEEWTPNQLCAPSPFVMSSGVETSLAVREQSEEWETKQQELPQPSVGITMFTF